ncbi:MAG: hypothetical protein RLZ95_1682 [Bacteroidota bacterium]|jgi:hypothetical protein
MVSTRISEVLNPSSILGEATNDFNEVEVLIITEQTKLASVCDEIINTI